jgi:16S rRNA processing protein RimM
MKPISELNLIKIGDIQKSRGYKGEVFIRFNSDISLKQETELVFLQIDGYMVPFFFSDKPKPQTEGIIVKFDEIDNDKDADQLIGNSVFTDDSQIEYPENDSFSQIEGYAVFDNENYLGKATGFLDIPSNPILEVITNEGNEILIPFSEEFIIEINDPDQKIIFDLPEGLTDINR